MTIKAFRSGETTRHWTDDCYKEKLTHGTDKVLFTLSMPSKGGGVTEVQLEVTIESFEVLAESMLDANSFAAVRAFVSAGYRTRRRRRQLASFAVEAMMDHDEAFAIRTVGQILKENKDAAVGACGTILLDKVGTEET